VSKWGWGCGIYTGSGADLCQSLPTSPHIHAQRPLSYTNTQRRCVIHATCTNYILKLIKPAVIIFLCTSTSVIKTLYLPHTSWRRITCHNKMSLDILTYTFWPGETILNVHTTTLPDINMKRSWTITICILKRFKTLDSCLPGWHATNHLGNNSGKWTLIAK
jgi:hypothetical protein